MRQILEDLRTGEVRLETVPPPVLRDGGVLVHNMASLISPGTEKMSLELGQKSLLGKARERPDLVRQVLSKVRQEGVLSTYRKVMSRLEAPAPLGYSCAGEVLKVGKGVSTFQAGDRVACGGAGYASHAEVVFVPTNLCVKIPEALSFQQAAFGTLGAIALQGVRQCEPTLGERVAVIGLGLVGQLTVQILKASGCGVMGVDLEGWKVDLARELGADVATLRGRDDAATVASAFSRGFGLDAVIITAATSSNDPIELAATVARDRARVVVVGAAKMDLPRNLYYEKELDVRLSRSYGPGRYDPMYEEKGVDYPIGYVRWTEQRNMGAFLDLIAQGKIDVERLITHRFDIQNALEAYALISGDIEEKYVGILLRYSQPEAGKEKTRSEKVRLGGDEREDATEEMSEGRSRHVTKRLNVGLIGAGSFAKGVILPTLRGMIKNGDRTLSLRGVATATGISAKAVGDKFGFAYCTTDVSEILTDADIDCVIISTRHDLHAPLAIKALESRKHVFVEKPMALSELELQEIAEVRREMCGAEGRVVLQVGLNRRFSPLAAEVKRFYENRQDPLVVNYRVNAGFVPRDHWTQNPEEGGGRIIGEVCHFVDLMQFLLSSRPIRVYAQAISCDGRALVKNDHTNITLMFDDGSIGTISYAAGGDSSFPKERVEVFGEKSVAVIEDFKKAMLVRDGKTKRVRKFSQDKGHRDEFAAFFGAVEHGGDSPLPFQEALSATQTTFAILDSINKGQPVDVEGSWIGP